jgi:hypothetical protein
LSVVLKHTCAVRRGGTAMRCYPHTTAATSEQASERAAHAQSRRVAGHSCCTRPSARPPQPVRVQPPGGHVVLRDAALCCPACLRGAHPRPQPATHQWRLCNHKRLPPKEQSCRPYPRRPHMRQLSAMLRSQRRGCASQLPAAVSQGILPFPQTHWHPRPPRSAAQSRPHRHVLQRRTGLCSARSPWPTAHTPRHPHTTLAR